MEDYSTKIKDYSTKIFKLLSEFETKITTHNELEIVKRLDAKLNSEIKERKLTKTIARTVNRLVNRSPKSPVSHKFKTTTLKESLNYLIGRRPYITEFNSRYHADFHFNDLITRIKYIYLHELDEKKLDIDKLQSGTEKNLKTTALKELIELNNDTFKKLLENIKLIYEELIKKINELLSEDLDKNLMIIKKLLSEDLKGNLNTELLPKLDKLLTLENLFSLRYLLHFYKNYNITISDDADDDNLKQLDTNDDIKKKLDLTIKILDDLHRKIDKLILTYLLLIKKLFNTFIIQTDIKIFKVKEEEENKNHNDTLELDHPIFSMLKQNQSFNIKYERIKVGYITGCDILHGYNKKNNKLIINPELKYSYNPGLSIIIITTEEQKLKSSNYNGYLELLYNKLIDFLGNIFDTGDLFNIQFKKGDNETSPVDAGGVSIEILIGNYIKQNFMCNLINENKLCSAENTPVNTSVNTPVNTPASTEKTKTEIDLSPKIFDPMKLDTDEKIKNLASVLKYYIFKASRLNEKPQSLGINFSLFTLCILFDYFKESFYMKLKLSYFFEYILNEVPEDKKKSYFTVPLDKDGKPEPYEQPADEKLKRVDDIIYYMIGFFYSIYEYYFKKDSSRELMQLINEQTDQSLYPFQRIIALVSVFIYAPGDNDKIIAKLTNLYPDKNNTYYIELINDIIKRLKTLEKLSDYLELSRYKQFLISKDVAYGKLGGYYEYNIKSILNISVIELGKCISESDTITADKLINRIRINYESAEPIPEANIKELDGVSISLINFLKKADQKTLLQFIVWITGSVTLPSIIRIVIYYKLKGDNINDPIYNVHTCSNTLYVHPYKINPERKSEIESQLESQPTNKIIITDKDMIINDKIIEALNINLKVNLNYSKNNFSTAGGSRNSKIKSKKNKFKNLKYKNTIMKKIKQQ
jgi:hypothetical protein